MATVPQSERQIKAQAIDGRVSLSGARRGAFASGKAETQLGRDLSQTAAVVDDIYEAEVTRAAKLEVLNAKEKVNQFELDLEQTAYSRKGVDATGVSAEVNASYQELTEEIEGQTSGRSKLLIKNMLSNRRRVVRGKAATHESQEQASVEKAMHAQGIKSESDVFASALVTEDGFVSPEALERLTGNLTEHYGELAKINGTPEEIVAAQIKEGISAAHTKRIERLVNNGKGMLAKSYLTNHGDELTEAHESSIEAVVKQLSDKAQAQDFADSVAGLSFGEQVKATKTIEDPEQRDKALAYVRQNNQIRETQRTQYEREVRRNLAIKVQDPAYKLTTQERRLLGSDGADKFELRQRKVVAGIEPVHNRSTWSQFSMLTSEELKSMSLAEFEENFGGDFDGSHYDKAIGLLSAAHGKLYAKPTKGAPKGTVTISDRSKRLVREALGIDPSKKLEGVDAERFSALTLAIDSRVREFSAANKNRQITQAELEQITIEVTGQTVIDIRGINTEVPAGAITASALDDLEAPNIKAAERGKVLTMTSSKRVDSGDMTQLVALMRVVEANNDNSVIAQRAIAKFRAIVKGLPDAATGAKPAVAVKPGPGAS